MFLYRYPPVGVIPHKRGWISSTEIQPLVLCLSVLSFHIPLHHHLVILVLLHPFTVDLVDFLGSGSYSNTVFTTYASPDAIVEDTERNAAEIVSDRGTTASTALRASTSGTYVASRQKIDYRRLETASGKYFIFVLLSGAKQYILHKIVRFLTIRNDTKR